MQNVLRRSDVGGRLTTRLHRFPQNLSLKTKALPKEILEMKTIKDIRGCMSKKRYNITTHARREMSPKEDDISERELVEAILDGGIIEDYPNDNPFPSCLIFGRTERGRPIHAVCAYSKENDIVIIVTTYEPAINKWIDYRYRRRV